jgi:hypothetical protein
MTVDDATLWSLAFGIFREWCLLQIRVRLSPLDFPCHAKGLNGWIGIIGIVGIGRVEAFCSLVLVFLPTLMIPTERVKCNYENKQAEMPAKLFLRGHALLAGIRIPVQNVGSPLNWS